MNTPTRIEHLPTDSLIPYATNARTHSPDQISQIAGSMREFGFTNPVLIDANGTIVAGHGRVMAARKLGLESVPCIRLGHLTPQQVAAYVIADNRLALNAGWDEEMLQAELRKLDAVGFNVDLVGFTDEELERLLRDAAPHEVTPAQSLSERFGLAPFTVLNAREGWWQDRKRAWLSLGIRSEVGRGGEAEDNETGGLLMRSWTSHPIFYEQKTKREAELGRKLTTAEFLEHHFKPPEDALSSGISIFDPVLCELAYRWFSPPGGTVIDPFAGGSVRGVVASRLGRRYVGHELRAEQVEANREQAATICAGDEHKPRWIQGDSRRIRHTCGDVRADMLLTCPPYADLEVYSDDPADISTLEYDGFLKAYREIVSESCALLVPDSFAVCVVGEVRDKRGNYLDFVGDTVQAFRDAGCCYYNEAILVTAVGSLPIRVGKQFSVSRKLVKTHQNVLVFAKGDGRKAAERCGTVEVEDDITASISE